MFDCVPLSVVSARWNMYLQEELCWRRMQQLQEENITVMGHVVGINKGGLMVDVFDLRGFMPMSHVPAVSKLLWHEMLVPLAICSNCCMCYDQLYCAAALQTG